MQRATAVLLALWFGSLWTICAVAAPTLFAVLDDRHAAGRAAAALFRVETIVGLVVAVLLFGLLTLRKTLAATLGPPWLITVTAAAPLISELILTPMMDAARAANDMSRFGLLHAVSAVLFFGAAVGALVLLVRFNRPAG